MTQSTGAQLKTADRQYKNMLGGLLLLLLVQLALSVSLKVFEISYKPFQAADPILACNLDKIDKIVIEQSSPGGSVKRQLTIQKNGNCWFLPQYFDAPASADSVKQLIGTLKGMKKNYTVSKSSETADRFKVSNSNYQAAFHLFGGPQEETLFIGSSPAFKQVYARADKNSEIYAIEISDQQMSINPQDWFDHNITEANIDDIARVDMGSFKLVKGKDKWQLLDKDNKPGSLNNANAISFMARVTQVYPTSILGTQSDLGSMQTVPVKDYSITLNNGKTIQYSISKNKENDDFILKTSNEKWIFTIDKATAEQINKFDFAFLAESTEKKD